jgi:hypothetical protein
MSRRRHRGHRSVGVTNTKGGKMRGATRRTKRKVTR